MYTWGWGLNGQLGHGIAFSELSPRHLSLDKGGRKNKAIQVAAGYEHSVVLLENKKIYWFGRNGTLKEPHYSPVKLELSDKIPEIFPPLDLQNSVVNPSHDFVVTKINCTWNKSLSLTDIIIADLRSLENVSNHAVQLSLKQLSQAWHGKEIEPPYIDAISKYFSVNTMRKPPSKPSKHSKPKHGKKHNSPGHKRKMY